MSRIRANQITNQSADGAPTVQNGLVISGVTTSTTFSGSGASLTNIPSAQLTGALPAISGANLTGITQTTINNNGSNRIITGSGTANTLEGESTFIYDGTSVATIDTSQTYATFRLDGSAGGAIEFYENGTRRFELYGTDPEVALYDRDKGAYHTRFKSGGNVELSDGNLVLASGHGIDFSAAGNASGMTSELLDDYEEGSFSPTLANGNNGYRFQQGTYTKIGNLVTFTAYIETSATPPSGNLVFGSLPYTSISGRSWVFPFHTNRTSFGTASFDARAYMGGNATTISVYYPVNSSSSNFQTINQNGMNAANASAVWISGSYQTAS